MALYELPKMAIRTLEFNSKGGIYMGIFWYSDADLAPNYKKRCGLCLKDLPYWVFESNLRNQWCNDCLQKFRILNLK